MGEVSEIKVLGGLALIDEGEVDWKMIAINVNDPLAAALNDVADIERVLPGYVSGIREWFRWAKTPGGKPLNQFGFNGDAVNSSFALEVIDLSHTSWEELRNMTETAAVSV